MLDEALQKSPVAYELEGREKTKSIDAVVNEKLEYLKSIKESEKESQARGRKLRLKSKPTFVDQGITEYNQSPKVRQPKPNRK